MPELPRKKVGIVACSGEEMAQGTVTRLAALKVLEELRPGSTVTICLPLFLAGGQGDRAFAKFYPTIAIDGCDKRCAARATAQYSAAPAASVVVDELVAELGIGRPQGRRRLDAAGQQAVDATAERIAGLVDELLGVRWDRRAGQAVNAPPAAEVADEGEARCSCGLALPTQRLMVGGKSVRILGLPVIFDQFHQDRRAPDAATGRDILDAVKVYNAVAPEAEADLAAALLEAYRTFLASTEAAP